MQSEANFQNEAFYRLPSVLADLLAEPEAELALQRETADRSVDASIDARGRRWLVQVKSSSRPGVIASVAEQLAAFDSGEATFVLVVPFMTPAGAKAAAERRLNWLDLSGNAAIRDGDLYISVRGRPNQFAARGRPSSPFAPKSSRIARAMLLEPKRWWRQKELSAQTHLDNGHVSRIVRRLADEHLLEGKDSSVRPRDPSLLLDTWSDEYRFDRHDIVLGHASGTGIELARDLHLRLNDEGIEHAFTGLPAAWLLDPFVGFRLSTVYVHGNPHDAAAQIGLRRHERGANVQLIAPDDSDIFTGQRDLQGIPCVAPIQVYLDLRHLPERADEAAENLFRHVLWNAVDE